MLNINARLFSLIIAMFSLVLLLSTAVYLKALRELNGIQAWVKAEIQATIPQKNTPLTEEEQAYIDLNAKQHLKRRRFLSVKFDQELRYLSLKQLDIEYRLAHNHCAHLTIPSAPHQACVAQVLQALKENRSQFEDLLSGGRE